VNEKSEKNVGISTGQGGRQTKRLKKKKWRGNDRMGQGTSTTSRTTSVKNDREETRNMREQST